MRFEPSGLYSAFEKMRDDAASKGKDLAFVMAGQFLRNMREEGRKIAPTAEELTATAQRLKGRLKREKGTPEKELARRIRAKGIFARKWKIARKESQKYRVRIWLIDTAGSSDKVDTEKRVSDKAEKTTGRKFKTKLDAMAERVTRAF